MPLVEINDLAKVGSIRDIEGYMLPPEAFTFANNMRFTNEGAERIAGRPAIFGTPLAAPHFTMPIEGGGTTYWLYTSLTAAFVYDGSTHTDITRALGAYTAPTTRSWNGTLLGGVPILNNGADDPQYWSALNPATKLAALPNWPANTKAQVIRAFGNFLLALNVTKNTGGFPHMVKWSHPADPGTVPSSWDPADPTKDAGENDLPDVNAGVIVDGLPLGGRFYVYKENSVWRMTNVGGQFIFNFDPFLETAGLLAPGCVSITPDGLGHVFASQEDMLVHNGTSAVSILDQKFKKFITNAIDTTTFNTSFMFTDPYQNEIWFCYPEVGVAQPNRAIIWNYKLGGLSEADVNFRNAAVGHIQAPSTVTWNNIVGSWDSQVGPWQTSTRRRVVVCDTADTLFLELDQGNLFNSSAYTSTLQRIGLGVIGRKRNGEWIVDFAKHKMLTRLWIKANGGPISVKVGFQELPDGPVDWSLPQVLTPDTNKFLDFAGSGKAISIEFSATNPFRILGYKPEIVLLGTY